MIIRILSGKSFNGLGQYLVKEEGRVAWMHTRNLAHDDMSSAIHEMYQTYADAELLKEQAGVRAGGRSLTNAVKHVSLNWSPEQAPTKEQMIEAAEEFLTHMKWHEHQAVLVAHSDKAHSHVHVMVNAVHPETGLKLDDFLERRRAQHWALEYERENGKVLCQQRLLDEQDREKAPTRDDWLKMKEAQQDHEQGETARRHYDPDYMNKRENQKVIEGEEWKILKEHQREQREAFFEEGKTVYRERRNSVYREVREEFRPEWREYFEAKRDGLDEDRLAEIKADILVRQKSVLDERVTATFAGLREHRDEEYALILFNQREARQELRDHQAEGLRATYLLDRVYDPDRILDSYRQETREEMALDDAFAQSAAEVCGPEFEPADRADEFQPHLNSAENSKSRDGIDSMGGLGLGALGAFATIGERFFDGFFGASPTPREQKLSESRPKPERTEERPRENPFVAVAEAARRMAEAEVQHKREREYWDDRARGRWD